MKHIDWMNPDQRQLTVLLKIMLFREALGPNGDNNMTYKLLDEEQKIGLILEFAVAFNTPSIHEFNNALDHLSPIITKPHLCLMINVDGAQEAMQGMALVPIPPKKRHPDFVPSKKNKQEEDSDENY